MGRFNINLEQGIILCDVKIRNRQKSTFLTMALDTGATMTLINPKVLCSIGINPAYSRRTTEVTTGSNVITCPILTIPLFTALGHQMKNLDVFCHTLPETSPVDGLLGLNFLTRFDLRLNFKQGFLEIR